MTNTDLAAVVLLGGTFLFAGLLLYFFSR